MWYPRLQSRQNKFTIFVFRNDTIFMQLLLCFRFLFLKIDSLYIQYDIFIKVQIVKLNIQTMLG